MENRLYKAFVTKESDGKFISNIEELNINQLPQNEVLIRVEYSSVNYKDALSATGNKGVTKNFPHTPGIDAAGIVESSKVDTFKKGDKVVVTGYDLGMNTTGGWGQYICVPANWVVKLPEGLTTKEAMIIGTAGFTAAISLNRLSELVKPQDGKVLVSGATGGVGSMALSLLQKAGYQAVAISRKTAETEFLKSLGAVEVIKSEDFLSLENKPILSIQYAGGIDAVGGKTLENMLKVTNHLGAVTTCGSVSGTQLNVSVFPFILRGISLIGVSSQNYPYHLRTKIWEKLATEWKSDNLFKLYTEIGLDKLNETVASILEGKLKGRTIVNMM